MATATHDPRLVDVPAEIRDRISQVVRDRGTRAAMQLYGIGRGALLAITAGLQVMPGTLALAEKRIREVHGDAA